MAGKFIVLSDIHLHLWPYGDPEARLDDQIDAIQSVLQTAAEEGVDAVLWTGDIFHTQGQVQTQVLRRLYQVLNSFRDELAAITVFLPGNHDMVYRNDSHSHALDFLGQFGHIPSFDRGWRPIELPNMPLIWPFPYTDVHEDLRRWLEMFANRDNDLLLMHQGVRGVDFQSRGFVLDEGLSADMVPPGVLHAFVGHCHSLRRVSPNLTVPGALQQHNFGDVGDSRGYLLVTYNDSGLTFRQEAVGGTSFIDIPYTEDLERLKEEIGDGEDYFENQFLRITNVPVSRVEEVRTAIHGVTPHDVRITTRADTLVPLKVQQHEIGDIQSLLLRFAKENDVAPDVAEMGQKILKETQLGNS